MERTKNVTLCSKSTFNAEKLKRYDANMSKYLYITHLLGQDVEGHWNSNALNIDQHNVSLNLNDYLIGRPLYYTSSISDLNKTIDHNDTASFPGYKCLTYHVPSLVRVLGVSFAITNSVFDTGYRPKNGFGLVLPYPQQKLLAWQFVKRNWQTRKNETSKS